MGGLSLYRAVGSNLQMVRPSLILVVKVLIIRAQSARQNFGPSYLVVRGALIALQLQTESYYYFATLYLARNLKFDKI